MPTTITSSGITFNDNTSITSTNPFLLKPTTATSGQVLSFNGSTWVASTAAGGGVVGNFIDKPTNATTGQVLTFNGSLWVASTAPAGNSIVKPVNPIHGQILSYNSANTSWVATTLGDFIPTTGGNLTGTLNGTSTARLVFGQTSISITDGVVTPVIRATNLYGDGSGLTNVILRTGGTLDGTITGANNARLTLGATNISTADGITTTTLRATNLYGNGSNITGVLLLAGGTITGDLNVNGKITTKGDISSDGDVIAFATSDKNLKKDIVNIPNSLDKVSKINGVYFNWINKPEFVGTDVGVIAQDVEKVLPEIVTTRANGDKAVQYDKLIPLLIESIKELKNQVDELKEQIKNK
jgi:hypothetical protein